MGKQRKNKNFNMKKKENTKEYLMEVMGKLDSTFKPKLNETLTDDKITQYRNSYKGLVPWELGKNDITIIDQFINKFKIDKEELYRKSITTNIDYESMLSRLWDDNRSLLRAALWKRVEK